MRNRRWSRRRRFSRSSTMARPVAVPFAAELSPLRRRKQLPAHVLGRLVMGCPSCPKVCCARRGASGSGICRWPGIAKREREGTAKGKLAAICQLEGTGRLLRYRGAGVPNKSGTSRCSRALIVGDSQRWKARRGRESWRHSEGRGTHRHSLRRCGGDAGVFVKDASYTCSSKLTPQHAPRASTNRPALAPPDVTR